MAATLLFVTSLPLVSLVAFAAADPDAKLPACCRKDGKHKCAMADMDEASGPSFRAVSQCPMFPASSAAPVCSAIGAPVPARGQVTAVVAFLNRPEQAEAQYRISFNRSRQKRGPPALVHSSI